MSDDILSPKEAAKLMSVSVRTLENWRRDEVGPRWFRLPNNGHPRYTRDAIDKWAEEREHKRAFQERHERKDGGMG